MDEVERALNALARAIDGIHDHCYICIDEFIEDANKDLEKAGIPFRYAVKKMHGLDVGDGVVVRKVTD